MSAGPNCPKCRTPLSPGVLNGLCPRCVLAAAMSDAAVDSTSPWQGRSDGPFEAPSVAEMREKFPHLQVTELVGTGGMGAVYRAVQPGLDRVVAVKILPSERGSAGEFAERFSREAKMLGMLNHPNIVGVYDFGQRDDLCYIVMEYVEGTTLRNRMQAGQVSPDEAMGIISQAADAIQYAHDQGIVHRDIKPENILIDLKGRVKIADFGLAKVIHRNVYDRRLTRTQQVMGTLRYMAPEQIERTRDVDHRADLYSLGVVAYEVLMRELPLGRFPLPSEKLGTAGALDQVLIRALEKQPDRRFQFAWEMKQAIDDVRAGRSLDLAGQVRRRAQSLATTWPVWLGLAIAAIVVVAVAAPVLVAVGILGGLGYAVYRGLPWLTRRTRPLRMAVGENRLRAPGFVHRMAGWAWRYNPIAVLFRFVTHRYTWTAFLAIGCLLYFILLWWPAWSAAEGTVDWRRLDIPGYIDREVWRFGGRVEATARMIPAQPQYESLTMTLHLDGTWNGYTDPKCGRAPASAQERRLVLKLESLDHAVREMTIDLLPNGRIFYESAAGVPNRVDGPLDSTILARWMGDAAGRALPADAAARQAVSLMRVIHIVNGPEQFAYPSAPWEQGRIACAFNLERRQDSATRAEFKEIVGRQNVDISRLDKNYLPYGIGSALALFVLGYGFIHRAGRRSAASLSTNNSAMSSVVQ